MLMTEQEARTKWCPKYQVCGNSDADNRPSSGANCITTGCMAWQWQGGIPCRRFIAFSDNPNSECEVAPRRLESVPETWEWRKSDFDEYGERLSAGFSEPEAEAMARRRGYCAAFSIIASALAER